MDHDPDPRATQQSHTPLVKHLPWRGLAFVAVLLGVALVYVGWTLFRPSNGVVVTKDLAEEVREYLSQRGVRPLSEPLRNLLADAERHIVPSQLHPLLGKKALDFELADPNGAEHSLHSFLDRGPVVLVFYYGYYCNHCVSQLFALDKDWPYFQELGTQIVALSPDPPADTRQRFRRYGEFKFTVLSDPKNAVAQSYGVFKPAQPHEPENLDHATFIIDRDGTVRWAQFGDEPFTDDRALLRELALLTRPHSSGGDK
jgi:peroxiredoxin